MFDPVQPHGRQPTRSCHPWDSPGKNTGVGCHFLLQCMKVKSESKVAQSCPTLSDPMDCSLPGSSVHGFSRQEYWSGLPLPSLHSYMITGKIIALTILTFVEKVMSLHFNMLSRLVIAFLSRSKRLLISWLQSISSVIWKPKERKIWWCSQFFPFYFP